MKDSLNLNNFLNLKSRVAGIATGGAAGIYLGYLGYGAVKASLAATTTVAAEATTGFVGTVIAAATANPVAAAAIGVAVTLLIALGVYQALKRKTNNTTGNQTEAKETVTNDATAKLNSLIKPSFGASLAAFAGSALAAVALGAGAVAGFGTCILGISLGFAGSITPLMAVGLVGAGLGINYLGTLLFGSINKLSFSLNFKMTMNKINKEEAKEKEAKMNETVVPA